MNSEDDKPEEDRYWQHAHHKLCVHDWVDLYGGTGVSKNNPNRALATFFCKRCLRIVTKSYDQSMFKLSEEQYED